MSDIPDDLRYAPSHEWVKLLPDGTALVGITDYAQTCLGDITFVQLPKAGTLLHAGASFGVVESVKAASDIYAPISGTVLETNPLLDTQPEILNASPYADGWFMKLQPTVSAEFPALLSAADYRARAG